MTDAKKSVDAAKRTLKELEFYKWSIEWQKVTGLLLMTDARTRKAGEEKLEDAKIRQDLYDSMPKVYGK
jgi:hypothetical protein